MRVLWFTNTSSCYSSGTNAYNGGGWISSLEVEIKKRSDIELGICFYANVDRPVKDEQDGTVYYLLPRPKKSLKYTVETVFSKPEVSTFKHEKLAMPALLDVVNDFRPDVIQVFGSENIYGMVAAYVSVPVVLHIQGILTTCLNAFLPPFVSWKMWLLKDKSLRNILYRLSDRIAWRRNSITEQRLIGKVKYFMGHSAWDERVTKLFNPDARYFYCGEILRSVFYDSDEERRLPSKPVFVSTISSQNYKGYDLVLKAARVLKDTMPDFEWKVFGDIMPKFVENVFGIRHEEVNVRLMGVATAAQIREALLSSTAYVHPSYIDNASNSLCEALMSGVPAVSTNTGGLPSVIDEGKTGFLVPTNDPFQMAYMMKWLYENEHENIIMGKNAREAALRRHDRGQIVDTVLSVYDELLNENR